MTPAEVATKLRAFNEWRRGDEDIPQFDPREISEVIDAAVEMIERLEAAEKEREIDEERIADLMADLNRVGHENDALRAKIERMEKQEPGFRERCTPPSPTGYSNRFPLYTLPGAKGEEK